MIIFIPIETNIRETIPKIFLTYKILYGSKYKVIIGGQRYLNQKIEEFKNCIWLDKHTFHERLKSRNIHKSNHVIVLDEEVITHHWILTSPPGLRADMDIGPPLY